MDLFIGDDFGPMPPPPMWPDDERVVLDFDPFEMHIPGDSLPAKVRYLLSRGIIYDSPGGRTPGHNMQLIALKCLYAAMVGFKKENLSFLYPNGKMGTRMEDLLLTTAQQVAEGPSVRDRCCGHVFEKGETYYRCKQCCADPTVVICSNCFNTQDHRNHAIMMLVGNGSGGCCDCGDPEAFNSGAPQCGIHVISSPDRESAPLPDEIRTSIKETMETALDFFIDVFTPTPLIKDDMTDKMCDAFEEWSRLDYENLSPELENNHGDWVAILYNDEVHSYPDVQSQLSRVDPLRYDTTTAENVAKSIDLVGRAAIMKSPDVKAVAKAAQSVMQIGLFCSIRTERDFLRECLGGYVLEWLMDCISIGVSVGGDEMVLREVMCQVLAGTWRIGIANKDPRVELDNVYAPHEQICAAEWATSLPTSGPLEERWVEGEYIRLDWILFFDARLWKSLRKCVKSIILGCLLGGKVEIAGAAIDQWGPRNWKRITGIRFARDFAQLCYLWIKYDREPHLSVTKLGVQIFTTPSISLELVERYQFLTHLLAIEFTYFTNEGLIGRPNEVCPTRSFRGARDQDDIRGRDQEEDNVWRPDVRIVDIQEDVHHLLGNEAVRRMIPKQRNWLNQFLHFFSLFQGMHVQKRETRQHREYESNQWEIAVHVTNPISRLMNYLAEGYQHATREELAWALQTTMSATFRRCGGIQQDQYPHSDPVNPVGFHTVEGVELVTFKVAEEYVSLYYPLNWMLSLLVSKIVDKDRDKPTDWDSWIPDVPCHIRDITVLTCVDYPLRANVFCSQIRAKLWTRNGMVMLRQCYNYSFHSAHSRSCSDFTFLQWGFAILPPETMLLAMLDRYDLVNQLTDPTSSGSHPIYRDGSLKVMIEEFFQLFLNLMNERSMALGESAECIVRREIAHRLVFKKLTHSDISGQARKFTGLDTDDHVDQSLAEMAQFHPPTESKPGMYELKPEFYSLVDPHHRSYTRNQAVECERILLDRMVSQGIPAANRVIEPPPRVLKPLMGPFAGLTKVLGTRMFTRVIFCAMRFAIASPSETILDQAIYLCLIAVMDESTSKDFVSHAQQSLASDDSPSLVHGLLAALVQPLFTALYPKIRCLLSKMKAVDPDWFNSVPKINVALSGVEDSLAATEAEHKKNLAKKRQMDALNKMKRAQSEFQAKYQALMSDSETEDELEESNEMDVDESTRVITFPFPNGTCILCQEETDENRPYGLPVMIHDSPLFRHTPLNDDQFVKEAASTPSSLDMPHPRPVGQANRQGTRRIINSENHAELVTEKILGKGFPIRTTEDRSLSVTTCGHLLHFRCWESYFKTVSSRSGNIPRNYPEHVQAGEFLCPLCRALSNSVFPIVWKEGINREMTAPVWSGLTLRESLQSIEHFRRSLKTPQYSQSNLNNRVMEVLPRLFPSLCTEAAHEADETPLVKYNKQNDHGRLKIYRDLVKDLYEKCNDDQLDADWDIFSVLLAGTITTVEISLRGTNAGTESGLMPPILGQLSSQDLMVLRVLSETVRTIMIFRDGPERQSMWSKVFRRHWERMCQLLPFTDTNSGDFLLTPLLETDIFERFVISCAVCSPAFSIGRGQLLLFYYVAEVTKISLAILESPNYMKLVLNDPNLFSDQNDVPQGPRALLRYLIAKFEREPSEKLLTGTYRMLQRFILPFLRKAMIFTHVYEGVIFSHIEDGEDEAESDRLCRLLGLPTLADVLDMSITTNDSLSELVQSWTSQRLKLHPRTRETLLLHHPAVFETIGLPERLDVLLELASKYRCPKCELVPDDPAMCLLCGEIVCAQSICCRSRPGEDYGEVNSHRKRCSQSIGIFLWMKRNQIIYLRKPPGDTARVQGELVDAPFMNIHGETDKDLRIGQPQFLSQGRYDRAVRTPLLKQAIETMVARNIEATFDAGGWETL